MLIDHKFYFIWDLVVLKMSISSFKLSDDQVFIRFYCKKQNKDHELRFNANPFSGIFIWIITILAVAQISEILLLECGSTISNHKIFIYTMETVIELNFNIYILSL